MPTIVRETQATLPELGPRIAVRAVLLGDRIDTAGLERREALSTAPLAFRAGAAGIVVVFRYGVAAFFNLTPEEQDSVLQSLRGRVIGAFNVRDEESAVVELAAEDQVAPGGPVGVRDLSLERLILVAYALADSVVLAHDEREVAAVFERTEPYARELAEAGRISAKRKEVLRVIGNGLLAQHRLSGRVAVGEDPDVIWDRPDLGRLYSRLKDEYELAERIEGLNDKLNVISGTARALADLMDSARGLRLELMIVLLIVFEIFITLWQIFWGAAAH